MASTASDLLKLELQGDGENDATWGQIDNVTYERIEQAIGGVTDVALVASNYALDDTQFVKGAGTTAEAHRGILSCTGTLTANVDVIVPARTKIYVVKNATGGAFTVTVKTAAGSGVVVLQGTTAIVWCDGTNVEFAGVNEGDDVSFGDLAATGTFTVGVAGGGTIKKVDRDGNLIITGGSSDTVGASLTLYGDLDGFVPDQIRLKQSTINRMIIFQVAAGGDIVLNDNAGGQAVIIEGVSGITDLSAKGAYFGTAAAANLLDDYEELTATTVEIADASTGGNTGTATIVQKSTKVGQQVTITLSLLNIDTTGMTAGNTVFVRGLPYSVSGASAHQGTVKSSNVTFSGSLTAQANVSTSVVIFPQSISGSAGANLTVAGIASGSGDLLFTINYTTTL